MPKQNKPVEDEVDFSSFFEAAEKSPKYWVDLAKVEFTEEVLARMQELGMSKARLAEALEVQPAMVTRIVSGQNNFELTTMVKIARALDCEFRSHLQRPGTETNWMDFLIHEPIEVAEEEQGWDTEGFDIVESGKLTCAVEA